MVALVVAQPPPCLCRDLDEEEFIQVFSKATGGSLPDEELKYSWHGYKGEGEQTSEANASICTHGALHLEIDSKCAQGHGSETGRRVSGGLWGRGGSLTQAPTKVPF